MGSYLICGSKKYCYLGGISPAYDHTKTIEKRAVFLIERG